MMRPTLTQSCSWMRGLITSLTVFLFFSSLQGQILMGYECGCDTSAPGFLGTHIQVTGGAGDNFEICNAVNYFSNPGDATPIPDGTPLIYDAALGFFIFDGYMNDAGIMPTLTIKQVDDAGVVIGTPLDAVLTTCMPGVFEINADAVSVDACVGGTDPTFTLGGYSAPTSPANILWTASPGTGVWINNPTALSTTITFQSPGTFTLTVQGIDSHRDCPFSDDIIVNVTDYNATVSISGTDPVCSGSPGTFTYNLTTGTMSDTGISWAVNGVATGDTDFDADITNPGAGTHTITAMGTSPDGCPFTATYELVVVDNPEIDFIMSDTYVCLGDDGFYEVAVPGVTAALYEWIVDGTSLGTMMAGMQAIPFSTLGAHTVEVIATDGDGCVHMGMLNIEVADDDTSSLACNNQVNLTMNLECEILVTADMILQGLNINNDAYDVILTDANGNAIPGNLLDASYIGQTITVMVTQQCGDNLCWGYILVEDKAIPNLAAYCDNSQDYTATCADLAEPAAMIGFPMFPADVTVSWNAVNQWWDLAGYDNCGAAYLTYEDNSMFDCTDATIDVTRTWTATDLNSGTTSTCEVTIVVPQANAMDIVWPSSYDDVLPGAEPTIDPCDSYAKNADGTPATSHTGVPVLPSCSKFVLNGYEDHIIPICGTAPNQSMKILRTWTVYDDCEMELIEHVQIITVMDTDAPQCNFSVEQEVFVDKHTCTIERLDFETPNIFNECGSYTLQYKYKVRDPLTGIIPLDFTLLPVGQTYAENIEVTSDSIWVFVDVVDECGNASTNDCFYEIAILDNAQPTAVCDLFSNVTLNEDGCAFAGPSTFDDNSHDNCGIYEKVIRRMNPGCGCDAVAPHFDFADFLGSYNGHHYYLSNHLVTGPKGFAYANAMGYYPVMVGDAAEGTWVNNAVRALTNDNYYIGIAALTSNLIPLPSDYVWNNGSTNPYRNWAPGQGTGAVGSMNTPGDVYVYADVSGDWFAARANGLLGRYVFEVEENCGWSQKVKFCCEDKGAPVMVQMRAIDLFGNHNECMVEMNVEDKTPPVLVGVPANKTIDCTSTTVQAEIDAAIAAVSTTDNCTSTVTHVVSGGVDGCAEGSMSVVFTATDCSGLTASQTWTLNIDNLNPFNGTIDFPDDLTVDNCNLSELDPDDLSAPHSIPTWTGDACSNVTYSHDDQVFQIVDDACLKILRTWTVIDWCQDGRYWNGQQVIKIVDSQGPGFTGATCNSETISGPAFGGSCLVDGTIEATAEDNCTATDDLIWSYVLTHDGQTSIGSGTTVSGPFEVGSYSVAWSVEDHCGNVSSCTKTFNVVDNKAPVAYCLDLVVTSIDPDSGEAEIWAKDLDRGTSDNCNGDITYSFSDTDLTLTSVSYSCDDLEDGIRDTFYVNVYYTDAMGNQSYCTAGIIIQDNQDACPDEVPTASRGNIAGNVITEDNVRIENVEISLVNPLPEFPQFDMTVLGGYLFEDILMYEDYNLSALKDDNYLNGVSTLDIVLIQKHILGLQLLNSPYKLIAADANNSSDITSIDLIELRKLILGIYQELPSNDSWRFVEEDFVFVNNQDPWPFTEQIQLSNLAVDKMDADFIGVKVGDVNNSVLPNLLTGGTEVDNRNDGQFDVELIEKRNGNNAVIEFVAGQDISMIGAQFSLNYNNADLLVNGLNAGVMDLDNSNINPDLLLEGVVAISWNKYRAIDIQEGDVLFSINANYMSQKNANLMLVSAPVTAEVYQEIDNEIEILDLRLRENNVDLTGFEVYQNAPNPFTKQTKIGFKIDVREDVLLQVMDYTGRVLYTENQVFDAGYHEFVVSKQVLNTAGMLFYQLSTETQTVSKKMVVLD